MARPHAQSTQPFAQLCVAELKNLLFIFFGVTAATFGVTAYLQPAHLIDGGVTGLSMLLSELSGLPLWLFIVGINFPFLLLGMRRLGKVFFLRATLAITALAISLAFIVFPELTSDRLLAALFGGVFLGAGIGLSIRGAAVIDGTEILALVLSQIGIGTVGTVLMILNGILFLCAAFSLGAEAAMYSILTYVSASRSLDFVLYGFDEYFGVIIVSSKAAEIRDRILGELGRGVTRFSGASGYKNQETEVLYSVVTRLEISQLKRVCREVDPSVFLTIQHISDLVGGTVRPRAMSKILPSG